MTAPFPTAVATHPHCVRPSALRLFGLGCVVVGLLAACQPSEPVPVAAAVETVPVDSPEDGGAVSTGPVADEPHAPTAPAAAPVPPQIDWSPLALPEGTTSISCELDYAAQGDGEPLLELSRERIAALLEPCRERGVLRLRYAGKITAEFTALIQRVADVADAMAINKRVLDLNSSGGLVEDAIKAGDLIAESRWTIWVREGAVCHSACVFVLGAGDVRMISGRVGIHRIIRMSSTASTRVELNKELRAVYERVRDYLERNGVATAVADLMMAVPNRNLRLLTSDELQLYGLDGINPAQDDLDRLRLMRKCGQDFVARRDAFVRAFDLRCKAPDTELETLNSCGLDLRKQFGFPDEACPAESPMSEFDGMADADLQRLIPVSLLPPVSRPVETAHPEGVAAETGLAGTPGSSSSAGATQGNATRGGPVVPVTRPARRTGAD
ncbi:COG3904 family protein [Luteimonas sp. RIT-PG2_3]